MDYDIIEKVNARFVSGNSISIDKANVPTTEWHSVVEYVRYLENLADNTMDTCNRQAFIIHAMILELVSVTGKSQDSIERQFLWEKDELL